MKLRLPHKFQAALMAAIASVSFTTLSSGTITAAGVAFFGHRAAAQDATDDLTSIDVGYADLNEGEVAGEDAEEIIGDQSATTPIVVGSNGSAGNNAGLLATESVDIDETELDAVASGNPAATISVSEDTTSSTDFTANPYATGAESSNGSDEVVQLPTNTVVQLVQEEETPTQKTTSNTSSTDTGTGSYGTDPTAGSAGGGNAALAPMRVSMTRQSATAPNNSDGGNAVSESSLLGSKGAATPLAAQNNGAGIVLPTLTTTFSNCNQEQTSNVTTENVYNPAVQLTAPGSSISSLVNNGNAVNILISGAAGTSSTFLSPNTNVGNGAPWTMTMSYTNAGDIQSITGMSLSVGLFNGEGKWQTSGASGAKWSGDVTFTATISNGEVQLGSYTGYLFGNGAGGPSTGETKHYGTDSTPISVTLTGSTINLSSYSNYTVTLSLTETLDGGTFVGLHSVGFDITTTTPEPPEPKVVDGLGNVMYVGDSITNGYNGRVSWRWDMFKLLTDNGVNQVEEGYTTGRTGDPDALVGATYGNNTFDNCHSACSGGSAYEVAGRTAGGRYDNSNIMNWLGQSSTKTNGQTYTGRVYSDTIVGAAGGTPDTFFLMVGTNDLLRDAAAGGEGIDHHDLLGYDSATDSFDGKLSDGTGTCDFDAIYNSMREANPNATIYVSKLVPLSNNYQGAQTQSEEKKIVSMIHFNALLERWAETKNDQHLIVLDSSTGIVDVTNSLAGIKDGKVVAGYGNPAFYSDGLHPNEQGELLVSGNIAKSMGYAGRTAGQYRKAATEFSQQISAVPAGATNVTVSGGSLNFGNAGASTATFSWDSTDLSHGSTVEFSLLLGNGETDGWDTTTDFAVTMGDGIHSGTLNINEAYIKWGSTMLYSQDASRPTNEAIRIAYVNGNTAEGLEAGYYVWLGDMMIGEKLQGSASAAAGVTMSYSGSGTALVSSFAMEGSGSFAPSTTRTYDIGSAFISAESNNTANDPQGNKDIASWSPLTDSTYADTAGSWERTATVTGALTGAAKGITVTGSVDVRYSGSANGGADQGVLAVYGGGSVTGDVYIQFDAANASYGHAENIAASLAGACGGSIGGSFTAVINAGSFASAVYGGGYNSGDAITGGTNLYINGGRFAANVYGGGRNGSTQGAAHVTVTGGTIAGNVYGGGQGGTITGGTFVTITGGTVQGNVYGGNAGETPGQCTGSVTVESNNALIQGNIYADVVTFKDISSESGSNMAVYAGKVDATTSFTLDHYTAQDVKAAISTKTLNASNNTNTVVRNLTLTACEINVEDDSNVTLANRLTLGDSATYTGTLNLADGLTIDVSNMTFEDYTTPVNLLSTDGGTLNTSNINSITVDFGSSGSAPSYTLSNDNNNLVLTFAAPAANLIWDGTHGGTWDSGNNWHAAADTDPGTTAFSSGDNVQFTSTYATTTATLVDHVTAGNMVVDSGATATVNTTGHNLTVASLTGGGSDTTGGTLVKQGNGTATINGTVNMNTITVAGGTTELAAEGSIGTLTVNDGAAVQLASGADVTLTAQEVSPVKGTLSVANGANLTVNTGATLKVWDGGSFDLNGGNLDVKGTLQVGVAGEPGGTFTMTGGSFKSSSAILTQNTGGNIEFKGGSVEFDLTGDAVVRTPANHGHNVRFIGTSDTSLVLKASKDWRVDKSQLGNNNLELGNFVVAEGNTGTITMKNAYSYGGGNTITNNATLVLDTFTIDNGESITLAGSGTTTLKTSVNGAGTLSVSEGATAAVVGNLSIASALSGKGNVSYTGNETATVTLSGDIQDYTGTLDNASGSDMTLKLQNSAKAANLDITHTGAGKVNLDLQTDMDGVVLNGTQNVNNITHNINWTSKVGASGVVTATGTVRTGRLIVGESSEESDAVFTLSGPNAMLNTSDNSHSYGNVVQGYGTFVVADGATQALSNLNASSKEFHGMLKADGNGSILTLSNTLGSGTDLYATGGGKIVLNNTVTSADVVTIDNGSTLSLSRQGDNALSVASITLNSGSILDLTNITLSGTSPITLASTSNISGDLSAVTLTGITAPTGYKGVLSNSGTSLMLTFAEFSDALIWDNHDQNSQWDTTSSNWHTAGSTAGSSQFTQDSNVTFETGNSTANLATDITAGNVTLESDANVTINGSGHSLTTGDIAAEEGTLTIANNAVDKTTRVNGQAEIGTLNLNGGTTVFAGGEGTLGTITMQNGNGATTLQFSAKEGMANEYAFTDMCMAANGNEQRWLVVDNGVKVSGTSIAQGWGVNEGGLNINGELVMSGEIRFDHPSANYIQGSGTIKAGSLNISNGSNTTIQGGVTIDITSATGITKRDGSNSTLNLGRTTLQALEADWTLSDRINTVTLTDTGFGTSFDAAEGHSITIAKSMGGDGLLVKRGAGVLNLNAANTYTGGTFVSGGTLKVNNGTALGNGEVQVFLGALELTTSTTTGALTLYDGTGLKLAGADNLTAASINLIGAPILDLSNIHPTSTNAITLATATGGITGDVGALTLSNLSAPGGYKGVLTTESVTEGGEKLMLTFTALPELIWNNTDGNWSNQTGADMNWHTETDPTAVAYTNNSHVLFGSDANGHTVTLTDNITAGDITIADGVVVTIIDGNSHTLTGVLKGAGTYVLAPGDSTLPGVTLDSTDWTGVVEVSGGLTGPTTLSGLHTDNSKVKMSGASFWFNSNGTVAADLVLNDDNQDNGKSGSENTAAMQINAADSGGVYNFTGDISGAGDFAYTQSEGRTATFNFQGDLSQWTGDIVNYNTANGVSYKVDHAGDISFGGGFVQQATSGIMNVTLGGTADSVAVGGGVNEGNGFINLTIDSNTTIDGDVKVRKIEVKDGAAATFKGVVDVEGLVQTSDEPDVLLRPNSEVHFEDAVTAHYVEVSQKNQAGATVVFDGDLTLIADPAVSDQRYTGRLRMGGTEQDPSSVLLNGNTIVPKHFDLADDGTTYGTVTVASGKYLDIRTAAFYESTNAALALQEDATTYMNKLTLVNSLAEPGTVTTTTRGQYAEANADDIITGLDITTTQNINDLGNKLTNSTLTTTHSVTVTNRDNTLTATNVDGGTLTVNGTKGTAGKAMQLGTVNVVNNGTLRLNSSTQVKVGGADNNVDNLVVTGGGTSVVLLDGCTAGDSASVVSIDKLSNENNTTLQIVNSVSGTARTQQVNIGDAAAAQPVSSYSGTLQYGVGANAASGSGMDLTIKDDNVAAGAVLEAYYDTQAPAGGSVNIIVDTENAKVLGLSDNINGQDANRAMKVYGTGEHTAEDAQNNSLEITGGGDYVYAGKLGENLDIAYTSNGSQTIEGGVDGFNGKVTVDSTERGVLAILNAASVGITDLTIGANDKLSIENTQMTKPGTAEVSGTLTARGSSTTEGTGTASVLDGNLTLGNTSKLDVSDAGGTGGLNLFGALTINSGAQLSSGDLLGVSGLGWYEMYDLAFSVTDMLGFGEGIDWSQGVDATTVFANTGLRENEYYVRYSQGDMGGNGNNVGAVYIYRIPEPTTGTLSLLALCALAARRRRK